MENESEFLPKNDLERNFLQSKNWSFEKREQHMRIHLAENGYNLASGILLCQMWIKCTSLQDSGLEDSINTLRRCMNKLEDHELISVLKISAAMMKELRQTEQETLEAGLIQCLQELLCIVTESTIGRHCQQFYIFKNRNRRCRKNLIYSKPGKSFEK